MKTVSAEEMRELDRRTIEDRGVSGEILMERAGRGIADQIEQLSSCAATLKPRIRCIAGGGNNGGDAFVVARILKQSGFAAEVFLTVPAAKLSGDALTNYERLASLDIDVQEFLDEEDWDRLARENRFRGVIVDGLLGTGSKGAPRGTFGAAVRYINSINGNALVVSVDLPTGLDADIGQAEGDAVLADLTVTMAFPKHGMLKPEALEYVGRIEVVDIGIEEDGNQTGEGPNLITAKEVAKVFGKRRNRVSHKGSYGRILVIGGSEGLSGSVAMSSLAALRCGAGLVTTVVPESIVSRVAALSPELMVKGAEQTRFGALSHSMWSAWQGRVDDFDCVLLGPGLGRSEESLRLVRDVLRDCEVPLVVDADAIAVLENGAHWFGKCRAPVVITPHPGEMALLMGREVGDVQKDRLDCAREASEISQATVILKGAGTCVAGPEKPIAINMSGNPGMATAGSGDVLGGMLVALLAQKFEPYETACAAVYMHGRAGDFAAWRHSETALIATDLLDALPLALRQFSAR